MKVLIIQEPDGMFSVVTDAPADVIVVCEHAPHDRLYKLSTAHKVSAELVASILGDDPIGSNEDERHEAISNRIIAVLGGEKHLRAVEKGNRMTTPREIVERLRSEGKDAFSKQYPPGTSLLFAEAASTIERLVEALEHIKADVEAYHVSCTCGPSITPRETRNIEAARRALTGGE